MKVSLASALGTCFGVKDAINLALEPQFKGELTIVGQLVHNRQVNESLKRNGVSVVDGADDLDKIKTKKVMITAHGAADKMKSKLTDAGLVVFDASCPLVMRVHKTIKSMVEKNYFPVVIGQEEHVEVKGIVGDLDDYVVVGNDEDLEKLRATGKRNFGIVSQTTQQVDKVEHLVKKIREMDCVDDVAFVNTICQPTRDRQIAVRDLADQVDLMIVIGGYNSSNTKKLVQVCDERNVEAHHIEASSQLDRQWFVNKKHVGITAGTSTPEYIINDVHSAILQIAEEMDEMETQTVH
ncbi:MAG: 4-hydroxy-3-methylbut-2-enyl diphosphate reductase [Nitrospinaceae bacterium]|nr:4-hydroxy-3-methylbut-2-enyl diphosphate reductase [Nitrospinaceae bacterium]NIR56490.1 4-hydroxy-3-methylbut-2-enyl diphosphate reductase [Nitrospinaceae bacterium]NIS86948.1 4-hydroxy-3-methylbut-2-enyl diphosphate reductase [Nitrospinaceae bacterium]NIT83792.1 4-hydroxy-3-methylbut-2-enyl diphosphate reductase [Nitrospinaceae bacterium]NIU45998.1 4-hydroxy-3-methylbut-2-enyl diphosphate reductase [Nitrospinaceae bacterium]